MDEYIKKVAAPIVMIDHHEAPEEYAFLRYSNPAFGSTCEMVFNVLNTWDAETLDTSIGTCLYTGIMTDSALSAFLLPPQQPIKS